MDKGLIEAAQAMGSSPWEIIFRVYLKESVPGIVRATTITFLSAWLVSPPWLALWAAAAGDFAIRYGHQRNMVDITYVTVVIILHDQPDPRDRQLYHQENHPLIQNQ